MLHRLNSGVKGQAQVNAYGKARFHSKRVRRLKFLLPAAAALVSLTFIAVSFMRTYLPENVHFEGATIENGKVVMQKPAISGRNADGINYSMLAQRALQDIKNQNLITLETIQAAVPVNDDVIARVEAQTADYDRSNDKLDLKRPFTVTLSNGITAYFQSGKVDVKGGQLVTSDPVTIKKEGTSIVAQSLKMTDKGRVIAFEGNVRVNVDPSAMRKQGT